MNPLGDNAQLLSNDVLAKDLIEDFPWRIQLSSVLPFLPVTGDQLRYTTTGPLTPGGTIGAADAIPDNTNQPNDPRGYALAELATHFRVAYKAQDVFSSNVNDQVAVQMALAVRKLLYKFWTLFESGDRTTNPNEFDGLLNLVDDANVLDLNGRALTLEDLDQAKDLVRTNDGQNVVIFTSGPGKRAIHAAHWQRGLKADYQTMDLPGVGRKQMLQFDGAPVFINDLNQVVAIQNGDLGTLVSADKVIPINPIQLPVATNIWFFALGEGQLHGIVPQNAQNIVVRSTHLPEEPVLVYHLTMPTAIALGSVSALSVIKNATIPSN